MRRNLILFILTLVCSSGAWAQMNFISEVKISAEAGGTENKKRLKDDGFTVIDQDLNAHEGGRDIYIGYKTTPHAEEAITGLLIMESGSGVDVRLAQYKTTPIEYHDKNYYRCDSYGSDYVDCDLNRKSGGADITLYYTKDGNTDDGGTPFIALTAVGENKSMSGYLYTRHWKYGTNKNSSVDENDVYGNTNQDNGSYKIYLPYQVHTHAYTATFNWADDGHSCSVTTLCACGHSSTGDAAITSKVKTPATYRVDGITTYTAKITLNNKEFTDTKDVQDIVMPLDEVKSVVKGMIDDMVANESRADMSALGSDYKAQVDAAATREDVWAIWDAFPADLDAAVALALSQAKEAAIAEIETALSDITDATLLATIQGYKDQINAATTTAAITSIKIDALAAIAAYKAEQERLRLLVEAKEAAIASIQALVSGSTDELVISTANKYIALIEAAMVIEDVALLRSEAERIIGRLLTEPDAFEFGFVIGSNNPTETQHTLEGVKMTYSANGEQMIVTINGKAVTYPLSQVSELTYFQGTPTVELTTHENPADPGYYYTTFYSGLEAYAIPDGVKAFTAELTSEGDALIVTQIESGVLPQDEGVLLESTSADAITLETTNPATGTKDNGNVFRGSDVYINRPAGTTYVISAVDNVMAFYQYTGDVIPANKAYMNLSEGQSAPRRIVWSTEHTGVATGMENAAATDQAEKFLHNGTLYIRKGEHVYNVQGVIVK